MVILVVVGVSIFDFQYSRVFSYRHFNIWERDREREREIVLFLSNMRFHHWLYH